MTASSKERPRLIQSQITKRLALTVPLKGNYLN